MKLRLRLPQLSFNSWIRVAIGIGIVMAFFVHEAEWAQSRFINQLELWAYDARLRFFMPKTPDPRVVIIDLDEKSLNAEGRWPWSRDKVALLVKQAFEKYGVRVIGFDVVFSEPDNSSGLASLEQLGKTQFRDDPKFQQFLVGARETLDYDRILAEEIAKHPVVLGFFLGGKTEKSGTLPVPSYTDQTIGDPNWIYKHHEASGYSSNIKILQEKAAGAGHLYPSLDFDGITRRVPILMKYEDGYHEAMAFAVLRTYLGNVPMQLAVEPPSALSGNLATITAAIAGAPCPPQAQACPPPVRVPLDDRMSALVPYRGATGIFRYISATDVMRGNLAADELRGKIAIVGTSAQGLLDLRATPVREDFPGVEVHANLISGFLDNSIKHKPDYVQAVSILTILLLGLPFAIFLPRLSAVMSTAAIGIAIVLLIGINALQWKANNFVLNLAAPVAMLGILYLLNMAWGFFTEARSRRLMSGLFGTYVPKELVEEMSKNPQDYSMRGESREMTVLFSDVRNFTSISEGLTPESLKDMMNAYLTEMTEVIQAQRGTIDKYIGDAIMAFWGAPVEDPNHVKHAVSSALDMQKRLRALDDQFVKNGWPPLSIGVGLNCGMMSVGDMGSKFRRAYTVLGDAVNLAARLEGLTKEYGVGILVSENIVRQAPDYVYRECDVVAVKGKTEGVKIYEPLGRKEEVPEATLQEISRWEKALEAYRQQRWDEAEAAMRELAHAAPETKLYRIFLKRIEHFRGETPGPAWNGTWVWTTK